MCFFKSLEFGKPPTIEPCQLNCHQRGNSYLPLPFYYSVSSPPFSSHSLSFSTAHPSLSLTLPYLSQICSRIKANNQNLYNFSEVIIKNTKKLSQNEKILQATDNLILKIQQNGQEMCQSDEEEFSHLEKEKKTSETSLILLTKFFGAKIYKYKLRLGSEFPRIIYKERRLKIIVRLIGPDHRLIRNANLLHLCLTASDADGNWIMGRNGESFIQGRSEVDLFRGEAEFEKVFPVDISRHLPGGRIYLIIYPKPSLLHPTGTIEKGYAIINHQEIEPLCIEKVLVKAKKRLKY